MLDVTRPLELGYGPAGDFAATVVEEVEWLVSAARAGERLPGRDDPFFAPLFDYAAEDRHAVIRSLASPPGRLRR